MVEDNVSNGEKKASSEVKKTNDLFRLLIGIGVVYGVVTVVMLILIVVDKLSKSTFVSTEVILLLLGAGVVGVYFYYDNKGGESKSKLSYSQEQCMKIIEAEMKSPDVFEYAGEVLFKNDVNAGVRGNTPMFVYAFRCHYDPERTIAFWVNRKTGALGSREFPDREYTSDDFEKKLLKYVNLGADVPYEPMNVQSTKVVNPVDGIVMETEHKYRSGENDESKKGGAFE